MTAGVAYFDTLNTKDGGGWKSLAGGRAVRFDGFTDLEPINLWVTNLSMMDFMSQGLTGATHLRNSSFFRMSLQQISSDCGFAQDASIPDVVETVSGIVNRAIDMALMSMPGINMRDSLSDSIYQWKRLKDASDDAASMYQPQFQAAFQENSLVGGNPWVQGSELVKLSMNRVDFAEEVLSYPYPFGAWREERSSISGDEFVGFPVPALACAEVDLRYADHPDLLAFGVTRSGTAVTREWITQPEASMLLSSGAKIRITNILRGSSSDDSLELPAAITRDALVRSSYSAGIVAENFMHALTSKRYQSNSRNARNKFFFPARAIYLKSIDRMLSYSMAKQLVERNYIVTGYGFGSVSIRVTEDMFVDTIRDAADMGFAICSSLLKQDLG